MEGAIAIVTCFKKHNNNVPAVFETYHGMRKPKADRLQRTAVTSLSWFEHVDRYVKQNIEQFMFNMMMRSKRVTYENLRLRDPLYIKSMDHWFAEHTRKVCNYQDIDIVNPFVPMFQSFKIGKIRVENGVELSAMCQYCAEKGILTD